jgi:hypothetical protein
MKIKMPAITNQVGSTVAVVKKERQLLRKADSIFVSSFKLRLSPDANVQKYELGVLLKTARGNPRYQSNAANYQFKLKSDRQGQYLTLKQQGWWSSFKGLLGMGREVREQQRTAAMNLINSRLGIITRPTNSDGHRMDMAPNDRLNFANAKSYQVNVFEDMNLGLPRAQDLNKKDTNSEDTNSEDMNSEDTNLRPGARGKNRTTPTMNELANGGLSYIMEEEAPVAHQSYEHVNDVSVGDDGPSHLKGGQRNLPESDKASNGDGGGGGSYALDPKLSVGIDEFGQLGGSPSSAPDQSFVGSIGSDKKDYLGHFLRAQLVDQLYGNSHVSGEIDELTSHGSQNL